jgi:hypothetical protein
MGNHKSKAKIHLDSSVVKAGNSVSGSVELVIPEVLSDFSLTLVLFQTEHVTFLAGGEGEWHKNHQSSVLFEQSLALQPKQKAGLYHYPFEIKTEESLAGSTKAQDSNYSVFITYEVVCTAKSKEYGKSKSTRPVILHQSINLNKPQNASNKAELKLFKTISKGNSEVQVDIAKLCYDVGEVVQMQVTVDNSSAQLVAKSILVKMFRYVKFEFVKTRFEERLQKVFSYQHPVFVPKANSLFNFKTFSFAFPIHLKEKYRKGCGTALGKIVESKYFFEVSVKFGKLASEVSTCLPVVIFDSKSSDDCDSEKTVDMNKC